MATRTRTRVRLQCTPARTLTLTCNPPSARCMEKLSAECDFKCRTAVAAGKCMKWWERGRTHARPVLSIFWLPLLLAGRLAEPHEESRLVYGHAGASASQNLFYYLLPTRGRVRMRIIARRDWFQRTSCTPRLARRCTFLVDLLIYISLSLFLHQCHGPAQPTNVCLASS